VSKMFIFFGLLICICESVILHEGSGGKKSSEFIYRPYSEIVAEIKMNLRYVLKKFETNRNKVSVILFLCEYAYYMDQRPSEYKS
jgi:hypothetical protein